MEESKLEDKPGWEIIFAKNTSDERLCRSKTHKELLKLYKTANTSKIGPKPWLVWPSGLSASQRTKGSPVQFPVRAYAWVVGQAPSRGRARDNHTLMFPTLPLFPST